MPALGLGTWRMGESARTKTTEVAAVRLAIELGYRLFDTAEMYGEGGAETVLGEAVRGAIAAGDVDRESLFIVSKVYPHNAGRKSAVAACERSLRRLGLDAIDLYLLHWRGSHPLAETVAAFEELEGQGRIRRWGVSNLDTTDMEELWRTAGGTRCATNQVWYSASRRGVEFDLLPWLQQRKLPLMAYSPIDQSELSRNGALRSAGKALGASAAQTALAWTLRSGNVIAVPKAVRAEHVRDNLAAASLELDAAALQAIDAAFPPPRRKSGLAMN